MPGVLYDDPRYKYDEPHLLYDGGWVTTGTAGLRVRARGSVVALKGVSDAVITARVQARRALLATPARKATLSLDSQSRSATLAQRASVGAGAATVRSRAQAAATHGSLGLVRLGGIAALASAAPLSGHQGYLGLRAVMGSAATYGPKAIVSYAWLVVRTRATGSALAVRPPPPTLYPLDPLELVDLGHVYRGDTLILPLWQARDQRGNLLDLTGALVWFTAKQELVDPDLDPPSIQVSTADGWVTIIDAEAAIYRVTIPPHETQQLPFDAYFTFDVQAQWDAPLIRTIRRGVLAVVCDVTRTPA